MDGLSDLVAVRAASHSALSDLRALQAASGPSSSIQVRDIVEFRKWLQASSDASRWQCLVDVLGLGSGPDLEVSVGTGCSGGNFPLFAMKELAKATTVKHGRVIKYVEEFGCESDTNCCVFMQNNFGQDRPSHFMMFDDITSDEHAKLAPWVNIYIGGFTCVNHAGDNMHTRRALVITEKELDELSDPGSSSETLWGSIQYIRRKLPDTFILENVGPRDMAIRVLQIIRAELPLYDTAAFLVDSFDFGETTSRRRWYFPGAKRAMLVQPVSTWGNDIANCRDALGSIPKPLDECCLASDSIEVTQHMSELRANQDALDPAWQPGRAQYDDHQTARAAIHRKFGLLVPEGVQLRPFLPGSSSLWHQCRARDVVGITCFLAQNIDSIDLMHKENLDRRLIWDVSRSLYQQRELRQPVGRPKVPAILRSHVYFDVWLQREYLPLEKLVMMGCPQDVQVGDLPASALNSIAGNGMSSIVVGVFLGAILKNVDFRTHASQLPAMPTSSLQELIIPIVCRRSTRSVLDSMRIPGEDHPSRQGRLKRKAVERAGRRARQQVIV